MSKKKLSKLLALYLPYVVIGLVATNLGEAWRLAVGKELGDKIVSLMDTLPAVFSNPLPSLHPFDLFIGLCCGAGMRLAVYLKGKNAKKYRHGMEYGSARWGGPKDIEPFMAPKFEDNIILTKTERLMMSNRPPAPKNARNKNVLVVGGSGSGKTRFFIKPNLLQCDSKNFPVSFVVTDPKGSIGVECGEALLKHGYKLKFFNTINFSKSMRYNPMAYIHSEKDVLKLVTALMTNTKGEGQGGDPFWDKAERLLLVSLIAYLHYEAPVEEQNFATLLEMLNTMQVSEDDETYQNPVDLLFEDLGKKKPKSFAVRQYKLYKLAAGKTAKSILISCGARLAPFDIQEVRDATMYDELELDKLGDRKTALFLIMSDTDSTFNFLISMIYTQLFNLLCDKADDVYGGKLPIHVRCLIDECANIGQIPQLEKLVATIRSREISACLVLQTRSQLKAIYKDNADTIVGNMDSQIFLGGSEPTVEVARKMAILPQSPQAPGGLTVEELVSYGRYPHQNGFGKLNEEDHRAIAWALEITHMAEFAQRGIDALSGGQRQRAWIAMALAQDTPLILLDEPTTYLDMAHQLEVLELLKELNTNAHKTIALVIHDLNLAARFSDWMIAMRKGEVLYRGTPKEIMTNQVLRDVFSLDAYIAQDPWTGRPICMTYRLCRK